MTERDDPQLAHPSGDRSSMPPARNELASNGVESGVAFDALRSDQLGNEPGVSAQVEEIDDQPRRGLRSRLEGRSTADWLITLSTIAVLFATSGLVWFSMHPDLIFTNTTPAGGDMGAHVWAAPFLRDHLLAEGRLTGWTPDWYGGFPAFQFYMLPPFLAMIVLDTVLPYGVAFKLVVVSGIVSMPVSAFIFGKLAGLRYPGPHLFAVATTAFLFDRGFTIYGGNIASTMAGEFAFSISLSIALVTLGVVARGMRTGKHRGIAAVLIALTGLTHIIPAFFVLAGVAALFIVNALSALAQNNGAAVKVQAIWLATVSPVAGLLAAFWLVPFYGRSEYLNDMGWEKLFDFREALTRSDDLAWMLPVALVGVAISLFTRTRMGLALGLLGVGFGFAYVHLPQGRLWNARILPFYYLIGYLLVAIAAAELIRLVARLGVWRLERTGPPLVPHARVAIAGTFATLGSAIVLALVAAPLGMVPGVANNQATLFGANVDYSPNFVRGWAEWNFKGYERKSGESDAYANASEEYFAIVDTMGEVGETNGCGRAFWEYEKELDRYGTPMALMLLPYWTDSCIGSMEGLYFEASASTPYHFLNQSELSSAPSRAQRDLPYRDFDIDSGIEHLQLLGVRYYMATSNEAVAAARGHEDLTEITSSHPWVVFEIADAELVTALSFEPVVWTDIGDGHRGWLDPSVEFYQDANQWDVMPAATGPDEWQRITVGSVAPETPVEPAVVDAIVADENSISFSVDQVGSPVLVKTSYFPNWQASGADGPYRVAPNLMVVVPTSTDVTLSYGNTPLDYSAWLLTLIGLVGLGVLWRRGAVTTKRPLGTRDPAYSFLEDGPKPAEAVEAFGFGDTNFWLGAETTRRDTGDLEADPVEPDRSDDSQIPLSERPAPPSRPAYTRGEANDASDAEAAAPSMNESWSNGDADDRVRAPRLPVTPAVGWLEDDLPVDGMDLTGLASGGRRPDEE